MALRCTALALIGVCVWAGCGRPAPGEPPAGAGGPPPGEWFSEVASSVGLTFRHVSGATGRFLDAEIFPPGAALFDYDNDGDLDVYLVQSGALAPVPENERGGPAASAGGRLFRNDLRMGADGRPELRFTDVTIDSGLDASGYGMGVATGDIDNDGWVDLYLTHLGANQLFLNDGDGTFTDVSVRSGTNDPGWSVSAAFVDVDRDGWLDLFVGNYLTYRVDADIDCRSWAGEPDYCAPTSYRPQRNRLYRNRGDGTFDDVTVGALIGGDDGPTLGVVTADVDGDGWVDLYVANDGQDNQLWTNQRDGTFRNTALRSGVAVPIHGRPEASMGVDAGDFDNDGDEDLVMTELTGEGQNLYVNQGGGLFEDRSLETGLGPPSLPYTGFGAGWFDLDNDGWLDVLTVNGAVRLLDSRDHGTGRSAFDQRKQLFRNLGNGRFEDVTARAGPAFDLSGVGRGAAFGDVDNDGDVDLLVVNNNGPAHLFLNRIGSQRRWVGVRLLGEHGRDGLGARVLVTRADGVTLWRRSRADASYASANDPRVILGLGGQTGSTRVEVHWPGGHVERFVDVPIDRWTTLVQGRGQ